MERCDDLLEDRNESRDSVIKRILKPLVALMYHEHEVHKLSEVELGADKIAAGRARMEINRRFGWYPNEGIPSDVLKKITGYHK